MDDSEIIAAFLALIRHELHLPAGSDAVAGLEARLSPTETAFKPPARAPGIARLRQAALHLAAQTVPQLTFERVVEDLRFLMLFGDDAPGLGAKALERLMSDVMASEVESTAVQDEQGGAAKRARPRASKPRKIGGRQRSSGR